MAYEVEIVNMQPATLASVRQRVPRSRLSEWVPRLLGEVWAFLKAAGAHKAGHNVAVYRDPGTTDIEVECGVQVTGDFEGTARVRRSSTPSGTAMHVVHVGDYAKLGAAYDALTAYRRAHGYAELVSWEVYGDWSDDPGQLRTDIYCLVSPVPLQPGAKPA